MSWNLDWLKDVRIMRRFCCFSQFEDESGSGHEKSLRRKSLIKANVAEVTVNTAMSLNIYSCLTHYCVARVVEHNDRDCLWLQGIGQTADTGQFTSKTDEWTTFKNARRGHFTEVGSVEHLPSYSSVFTTLHNPFWVSWDTFACFTKCFLIFLRITIQVWCTTEW